MVERIKINPDFMKRSKRPSAFAVIVAGVVIAAFEVGMGAAGAYLVLGQLHAVLVAGVPVSWSNALVFSIGVNFLAWAVKPSRKS